LVHPSECSAGNEPNSLAIDWSIYLVEPHSQAGAMITGSMKG
jgi:hypothetical protein